MTQKNFMSARGLTMEEMENVNGGRDFTFMPKKRRRING